MLREAVAKDGFGTVQDVFEPERLDITLRSIEENAKKRSRAGIRHLMSHPVVAALANERSMLQIAAEVLGGTAIPFRATLFDKSDGANWLVVWHQDTALPLRARRDCDGWGPWSVKDGVTYAHAPTRALEQVIALRLHFDDSTATNGPLRVLPGTHKLGVLGDDEVYRLSSELHALDCLAPKGSVLAMRPLLIHASSKSQNEAPRRVLHIEYSSSMSTPDGLELAAA